jgi:Ca2+-transporting ATPase
MSRSEIYCILTSEQTKEYLHSSDNGLSSEQAHERLNRCGLNTVVVESSETLVQKILDQLNNPLILLLFGSAFLSLLLGHLDDCISITLAILIVTAVAFVQEYSTLLIHHILR